MKRSMVETLLGGVVIVVAAGFNRSWRYDAPQTQAV